MCGLIFLLSKGHLSQTYLKRNLFAQGLIASVFRGDDATGVFATTWKNDKYALYKSALPAPMFTETKKFGRIMNNAPSLDVLLGHTRAGTMGGNTDEEAHPFTHGHITLAHNGVLRYWAQLPHDKADVTGVDSDVLCNSFYKVGYKEALKQVEGDFALTWYDSKDKTVRITRNEGRPLYFLKVEGMDLIIGGSEFEMLRWLLARNGVQPEKGKSLFVPPPEKKDGKNMGTILAFNEEMFPKFKIEKVEFYTPKPIITEYKRPTDYYGGWGQHANWYDNDRLDDDDQTVQVIGGPAKQPASSVKELTGRKELCKKLFGEERLDREKQFAFHPWFKCPYKTNDGPGVPYKIYGFIEKQVPMGTVKDKEGKDMPLHTIEYYLCVVHKTLAWSQLYPRVNASIATVNGFDTKDDVFNNAILPILQIGGPFVGVNNDLLNDDTGEMLQLIWDETRNIEDGRTFEHAKLLPKASSSEGQSGPKK